MKESKLKSIFVKVINKETILYLVFGVLTTLVNFVVFYLCDLWLSNYNLENYAFLKTLFFGKPYLLSNTIAWIVAVIFAFFTNKYIVFESKSRQPKTLAREFGTFVAARVLSFFIEQIGLYVLIDMLLQNKLVSKVIISVIVVILNYFFSKLIIFKKK